MFEIVQMWDIIARFLKTLSGSNKNNANEWVSWFFLCWGLYMKTKIEVRKKKEAFLFPHLRSWMNLSVEEQRPWTQRRVKWIPMACVILLRAPTLSTFGALHAVNQWYVYLSIYWSAPRRPNHQNKVCNLTCSSHIFVHWTRASKNMVQRHSNPWN